MYEWYFAASAVANDRHESSAFQPINMSPISEIASRTSPTTGTERCLMASKRVVLTPMNLRRLVFEYGPRTCGEVLQAGSQRNHDIGTTCELVGRRASRDTDGTGVQWVRRNQRRLTGNGLHYRHAMSLGELLNVVLCKGVVDASTGNDQGALCGA